MKRGRAARAGLVEQVGHQIPLLVGQGDRELIEFANAGDR